ncbi:MAG: DUF2779 domain-containing protein [Candidatus Marinimicrobia bacterium]|jgi:hypothetical protein|nr:DUF2779 domain-containing protein [Candidatus Neomarinimicrobiota bacterium]MBT4362101.1 DUF2779 domain-containing protein [Candidatus Neomarinimicrobiota bacterium]
MSNSPRYLTKSRFKSALECPTKLYYYGKPEYANRMNDDEFMQALCEGGYQVGELAKYYFPGGHDIKSLGYDESLAETNALLEQDNVIIYEAAIQFEHTFIRVDVLKKEGKRIELIEVKAKSFKTKEEFTNAKGNYLDKKWYPYLADVAFQTWVMERALPGHEIIPYLMLTDKNKKATVDGLNQLFRIKRDERDRIEVSPRETITPANMGEAILAQTNVSEFVKKIFRGEDFPQSKKTLQQLKSFEARIAEYGQYYAEDQRYPIITGTKCKGCEYKNTAHPDLKSGFHECMAVSLGNRFDPAAPSIFDIWNFRKSAKLMEQNIFSLEELKALPDYDSYLNDRQRMQVDLTLADEKAEVIAPELRNEMNSWIFPLHFIDFETSMVALPFTAGRKPYEQTAFQFSCHTLHKDGRMEHFEWIDANQGVFPNFDFVKQLKAVLDKDDGTIFRYAAHENTVLRQIQSQMVEDNEPEYAELIEWIDSITEWKDGSSRIAGPRNMVDMLQLVRDYYYHPDMGGSNSIKKVLPAVMTGDAIKVKYSKPLEFGTHLKARVLYELDSETNKPVNPYYLLPSQYGDLDLSQDELIFEDAEIQQGGAALIAYGKMQFTDMSDIERDALSKALLQYCELDTLAMVMIYEHWKAQLV